MARPRSIILSMTVPRSPRPLHGIHVGRRPPPIGGVTIHCDRVERRLADVGLTTPVVSLSPFCSLSQVAQGAWLMLRANLERTPVWIHFSTLAGWRALRLVVTLLCLKRAEVYLVPHSGLFPDEFCSDSLRLRLVRKASRTAAGAMCFSRPIEAAFQVASPWLSLIPADSFVPDELSRSIRLRERRINGPPTVLMSGDRTATYGYLAAIQAVALLRSWKSDIRLVLYVYGRTDRGYWKRVQLAARQAGFVDIVEDAGQAEFLMALRNGDMYLRNTTHDSYGVACVEAAYMGARSLATDVCDRGEGVQTFRGGNPGKLALEIRRCLASTTPIPSCAVDGAQAYIRILSARHDR